MAELRIAAVAANFGRELDRGVAKVLGIIGDARARAVDLLVLPHAVLGGYLADLRDLTTVDLPPALDLASPQVQEIADAATGLVVCFGFTEHDPDDGGRWNSAVCVGDGRVFGHHRKVHQPDGECLVYT
ncbi:MAG: nitrilase-related carbon-nitrogen hydrolase, partial [Janthinobacterium lividum]